MSYVGILQASPHFFRREKSKDIALCSLSPQTDELPYLRLAPYFDLRPDIMLQNHCRDAIPECSVLGMSKIGPVEAEEQGF